jgi:hypothetical protein
MKKARVHVVGVLIAAGLGLAACSSAPPPPPKKVDASVQLAAGAAFDSALQKLKTMGFDATLTRPTQGVAIKATEDYAHKSATETETFDVGGQTISITATLIGRDLWFKADFGALATSLGVDKSRWYQVDSTKLVAGAQPFDFVGTEPLAITAVFTSYFNMAHTDPQHFTGLVDLTTAVGPHAPDKVALTAAGPGAATTPFTADVDAKNQVTDINITPKDGQKDLALEITFANYGTPTTIAAPAAAQVLPASPAVYQALNRYIRN